jgi:hypothetical protein
MYVAAAAAAAADARVTAKSVNNNPHGGNTHRGICEHWTQPGKHFSSLHSAHAGLPWSFAHCPARVRAHRRRRRRRQRVAVAATVAAAVAATGAAAVAAVAVAVAADRGGESAGGGGHNTHASGVLSLVFVWASGHQQARRGHAARRLFVCLPSGNDGSSRTREPACCAGSERGGEQCTRTHTRTHAHDTHVHARIRRRTQAFRDGAEALVIPAHGAVVGHAVALHARHGDAGLPRRHDQAALDHRLGGVAVRLEKIQVRQRRAPARACAWVGGVGVVDACVRVRAFACVRCDVCAVRNPFTRLGVKA